MLSVVSHSERLYESTATDTNMCTAQTGAHDNYMYCMYDHHAHSIHLAPRGLHSSVQVPQSQSKVRQTHKDNEDMKSLSFQTCSYSSRQVVRNERQNEQFLRR